MSLHRAAAIAVAALLSAAAAPAPAVHVLIIDQMAFGAAPTGLRVGDIIEWRNADIFRHTATARDASFDVDLAPKKTARVRLARAGEVAFYCRFHPGMTGKLMVQGR